MMLVLARVGGMLKRPDRGHSSQRGSLGERFPEELSAKKCFVVLY